MNSSNWQVSQQRRRTPPFTPREVTLTDQFETKNTSVIRPLILCNPVDLNGQGIANNQCHLLCYRVRDTAGQPEFVPQEITVEFSLSFQVKGKASLIPMFVTGETGAQTGLKVTAKWK